MTFVVDGSLGGTFPTWTTATRPATPTTGQEGFNTTTGVLEVYNGSAWFAAGTINPSVTTYTSGSGTYTTPTGAKYLIVEMVGGGGGGAGGGTASWGTGGNGGNTTFGANTAYGGTGASTPWSYGGAGGSYSTSGSTALVVAAGGMGGIAAFTGVSTQYSFGGNFGGSSAIGPGGAAGNYVASGQSGAGYGAGGGGGGCGNPSGITYNGAGGGGGGYMKILITSPSATYSYAVGAAGTAGAAGAGSNAAPGAAGVSGVITITAYF